MARHPDCIDLGWGLMVGGLADRPQGQSRPTPAGRTPLHPVPLPASPFREDAPVPAGSPARGNPRSEKVCRREKADTWISLCFVSPLRW